ncbi:response regulator transcription factor [Gluconobacter japonicus]|uniref:response regulator transcription factor n=1 Tax=Gluconobacter japonicus TaxID=376620 RepID=UPI000299D1B3|nr:response regulator transcription factor [Gluconobacter japonicus]KXV23915.1 hypothetical protein AD936_20790 [Gluconobacter japonicus]KXV28861.1 hypothetical protein AD937_01590 [Gluconobacter japonicus]GAP24853.1 two component response regulator CtrA [Gluconobacter frateurii NBRC 101659]
MRLMTLLKQETGFRNLVQTIHAAGYGVDSFHSSAEAREALFANSYDLIVVDQYFCNKEQGCYLLERDWRDVVKTPYVIMIATEEQNRIFALENGADDCVSHSVNPRELVARIRAILRRPQVSVQEHYRFEELSLCLQSREVRVNDVLLPLQRRETAILESLIRRKGKVVPRSGLEHDAYGALADCCPNALEVRISRIRRQLGSVRSSLTIEAVRGVGYRLAPRSKTTRTRTQAADPGGYTAHAHRSAIPSLSHATT